MMRVLKTALLLTAAVMAFSSLSFGSILCDGAPTTILAASAGGGCQFGSNLFTNISISTSTESPGTPVDAINPGTVSLSFTGATTNPGVVNVVVSNTDAASWALTGTQQFSLILTYTVTGSAAYFSAFADSFNGSGTIGGNISLDKAANNQVLPNTLSLAMMSQAPLAFTGGPIQTFNVTDNITVHATNATATLVNATNSFTMVQTTVGPVPEPTTAMLLGSGLAIGLMLRKTRKRRS